MPKTRKMVKLPLLQRRPIGDPVVQLFAFSYNRETRFTIQPSRVRTDT
jgi:hypothetical protein